VILKFIEKKLLNARKHFVEKDFCLFFFFGISLAKKLRKIKTKSMWRNAN
jgi:hypothetical protein